MGTVELLDDLYQLISRSYTWVIGSIDFNDKLPAKHVSNNPEAQQFIIP
jgi:hypothetical protein